MNSTSIPALSFSWIDYTVFTLTILISAGIGLYFGFFGGKNQTTQDYLLGGKKMTVLPVAFSLISSHISGVTVLAIPTDVYKFGSNYIWLCLTIIIVCFITYYVYLPVFFDLQLTSMYEYLSLRFNKKIRTLASLLFVLSVLLHSPIAVYLPVIAFTQVTNIDMNIILYGIGIICIFYTAIGGVKAVVWSDAFQFFGIVISSLAVLWLGISASGGLKTVWHRNIEGDRLDILNFSLDPTLRDGFWSIVIGGTIHWLSILCLSQQSMQKYLSVPTSEAAKKVLILECIGVTALKAMSVFLGNTMYSKYWDCDPLSTGQVERADQLVPYFVLQTTNQLPGLTGIFTAGILSASLSSFSTNLNSVACIIYEDFVIHIIPKSTTKQWANSILKLIVIVFGTICILLVYSFKNISGIFPLSNVLQAVTSGPLMGLFTLGILFPFANTQGALYGGLSGIVYACWIAIGAQWYKSVGILDEFLKPTSTSGCQFNFNQTISPSPPVDNIFVLYRVSMWYNGLMSASIVILVGLLVSWLTRKKNHTVSERLISPLTQCFLKIRRMIRKRMKWNIL